MLLGKDIGKTSNGSKYIIYQDSPTTFHFTVTKGDVSIYDFMESPESVEALNAYVNEIALELDTAPEVLYLPSITSTEEVVDDSGEI